MAAFVILGLVILTTGILIFTFRAQLYEAAFGKGTRETLTVPPQAEKVKILVESCIRQVAEEAVGTIALQGGYINLPANEIPASLVHPYTNNLDLFNNKGVEVPFWFFEDARGLQQTQMPTPQEMEEELATFMDNFLEDCTSNFASLEQQGYSITPASPTTTVDMRKNNVLFSVNYPIDVTLKDFSFRFDTFRIETETALQELYTVAKEIMEYENENYFIEDRVLDMMVVYDTIPFSGVDFECSPRSWTKTDVYTNLKSIVATNLPTIKIEGTHFIKGTESKSFVIDAVKGSHDLTTNFRYDESWPFLVEVVGENGEILRGEPFTAENEISRFLLPIFCLNNYHFVYNLRFPVVITLEKEDEVFQFATLGIVQNNQPRENRAALESFKFETPICDYPSKNVDVLVEGYGSNGVVRPLNKAQISFKCLNQVCELGNTIPGGAATKKVPSCFNGVMIAESPNFHRAEEVVSTNQDVGRVTLTLEPIKEVAFDVIINDEGTDRSPYDSEQILFTFENEDEQYITSVIYPLQKTVKLVAGNYFITSSLIIDSPRGFTMDEKEIEVCSTVPRKGLLGIAGLSKKQCVTQTIDKTTIDTLLVGGSSVNWFLQREALLSSDKVTLYTHRGPTPQSMDEVTEVYASIGKQGGRSPVLQ